VAESASAVTAGTDNVAAVYWL